MEFGGKGQNWLNLSLVFRRDSFCLQIKLYLRYKGKAFLFFTGEDFYRKKNLSSYREQQELGKYN